MSSQPDQPLAAANIAQLVAVTMRLAMEVTVLRDRVQTHEALLARHGLLDTAAVDAHAPDAAQQAERDVATRALITALAADLGAMSEADRVK
jgi:predicted HD phosphohydrolase